MVHTISIDEHKRRCYICWETCDVIRCHQCKYGVCERCLVRDDRFSTVVPKLCRHTECAYPYLDKEERDKQNCFVCSKQPVNLEYRCGMCVANSQIDMNIFVETLKLMALERGEVLKTAEIIDQTLVYYTIKDLDTGRVQLLHFWEIPQRFSNREDLESQSDHLTTQT